MDIVVKNGVTEIASGTLTVDTSTTPPTGTFTPTGGTEITCNVSAWSSGPSGATNWSFRITEANGDFPIKENGKGYTYNFIGNENAEGSDPSGSVNWPSTSPKEDETVTWQGEATVEEPSARGQGAG